MKPTILSWMPVDKGLLGHKDTVNKISDGNSSFMLSYAIIPLNFYEVKMGQPKCVLLKNSIFITQPRNPEHSKLLIF